jgi:hypothetical protein
MISLYFEINLLQLHDLIKNVLIFIPQVRSRLLPSVTTAEIEERTNSASNSHYKPPPAPLCVSVCVLVQGATENQNEYKR